MKWIILDSVMGLCGLVAISESNTRAERSDAWRYREGFLGFYSYLGGPQDANVYP